MAAGRMMRLSFFLGALVLLPMLIAAPGAAATHAALNGTEPNGTAPNGTAPNGAAPTPAGPTSAVATWTAERAIAALTAAPVVRMPGSPAVFDERTLTKAIGTSGVKILAVPFALPEQPTSSDLDDTTSEQLKKVRSWASTADVDLIVVVGLKILVGGIFEQRPDTVPDLRRIMLRSELTQSLRFSVAFERFGREAADKVETPATPEPAVPADRAADETIVAALAEQKYYAAPGVAAPEGAWADWQVAVGPDRVVRVALLAAPAPDQPLIDEIGPLRTRFPHDIVVVAHGRWIEIAGPEQQLLDSAILYGYGAYYDRIAQNDVPLANLVLGMLRRVGDLRAGTVSDQQGPATDDPVSGVSPALPWLFVGTALLAGAGLVVFRRRRTSRAADTVRDELRERARTTAGLAVLSEEILQLDGLAQHGRSRMLLSKTAERYGTARDLQLSDGDPGVARRALKDASVLVRQAATELKVPLAPPPAAGDRTGHDGGLLSGDVSGDPR